MHVCMYVCMYVYVCICACVYRYVCVHVGVCMLLTYITYNMHACMHACMHVCHVFREYLQAIYIYIKDVLYDALCETYDKYLVARRDVTFGILWLLSQGKPLRSIATVRTHFL